MSYDLNEILLFASKFEKNAHLDEEDDYDFAESGFDNKIDYFKESLYNLLLKKEDIIKNKSFTKEVKESMLLMYEELIHDLRQKISHLEDLASTEKSNELPELEASMKLADKLSFLLEMRKKISK